MSADALPAVEPRAQGVVYAPDSGFDGLSLPPEPLTLVAVEIAGCTVVGLACEAASPGQDVVLSVEATGCTDGCVDPFCADGCCAVADDPNDCDGDGLDNGQETDALGDSLDTDADGVDDVCDLDSDADGLPDAEECRGVPNCDTVRPYRLNDSDGDGVADGAECCGWAGGVDGGCDVDGDGLPAHLDDDSDGDGVPDGPEVRECEPSLDCDADELCNAIDPDADGDGAVDGRECHDPGTGQDCSAAWDAGEVRCDERVFSGDDYCDVCCARSARCAGLGGPASNYCVPASPAAEDRPGWRLLGPPTGPVRDIDGFILLEPMLYDGDDANNHRVPQSYSSVQADSDTFGAPESATETGLLAEYLQPESMTCLSSGAAGPERCLAIFGIRLSYEDGGSVLRCSSSDAVLVIADHFGDASSFAALTDRQQRAIGAFDRGYQFREPAAAGQPWTRSESGSVLLTVPDPAEPCMNRAQFAFQMLID